MTTPNDNFFAAPTYIAVYCNWAPRQEITRSPIVSGQSLISRISNDLWWTKQHGCLSLKRDEETSLFILLERNVRLLLCRYFAGHRSSFSLHSFSPSSMLDVPSGSHASGPILAIFSVVVHVLNPVLVPPVWPHCCLGRVNSSGTSLTHHPVFILRWHSPKPWHGSMAMLEVQTRVPIKIKIRIKSKTRWLPVLN